GHLVRHRAHAGRGGGPRLHREPYGDAGFRHRRLALGDGGVRIRRRARGHRRRDGGAHLQRRSADGGGSDRHHLRGGGDRGTRLHPRLRRHRLPRRRAGGDRLRGLSAHRQHAHLHPHGARPPLAAERPVRTPGSPMTRWILRATVLLLALLLPYLMYPTLAVEILCGGLFALAFDLVFGYVGLLSFGHAAFWGMGSYVVANLLMRTPAPVPLAILAGAVAALVVSLPIGYLSIRSSG